MEGYNGGRAAVGPPRRVGASGKGGGGYQDEGSWRQPSGGKDLGKGAANQDRRDPDYDRGGFGRAGAGGSQVENRGGAGGGAGGGAWGGAGGNRSDDLFGGCDPWGGAAVNRPDDRGGGGGAWGGAAVNRSDDRGGGGGAWGGAVGNRSDDRGGGAGGSWRAGGGSGAVGGAAEPWRPNLKPSGGDSWRDAPSGSNGGKGVVSNGGGSWRDEQAQKPTNFGASALGGSWRDTKGSKGGDFPQNDDFSKGSKGGGKRGQGVDERGDDKGGKKGSKGGKSGKEDDDYNRGGNKGSKGGKGKEEKDPDYDRGDAGKGGKHGGRGDAGKGGKDGGKDGGGKNGGKKGGASDEPNERGGKSGKGKGKKGEGKKGGGKKEDDDNDDEDDEGAEEVPAPAARKTGGSGAVTGKHLSDKKFGDLDVSNATKRALAEGFGYELMTQVQAQTVLPMLAGKDVVARAKTGTGKTLAFLVPIVESISKWPAGVGGNISALIMSPTRELASQIAAEATVILRFHPKLGVACFYGGVNIKGDHKALASAPVDILVATPGRLQDHLDNSSGFKQRVSKLTFLALDEADQLLDMGFRDSILKILKALPPPHMRQGALFSATFPNAVGEIAKLALRAEHVWLDTVHPDEEVTPDQIDQSVCVTNMEGMTELLWQAVNFEMTRLPKEYKIMVFFTTARATQLYSELFGQAKVKVHEVHSRKSQAHRNRCADEFRKGSHGIIFSSDVSARGLDYPDVTTVIQVGVPSARDQYIHRLGRTGRAGKSGRCILLLHDFEEFFLKDLKDLPVKRLEAKVAFAGTPAPPDTLWEPNEYKTAGQAYQAFLGYYNSVRGLGWSKEHLVQEGTRFAASIGGVWDGLPPPILRKTVGMMGLKGVPGLNIVSALPYGD